MTTTDVEPGTDPEAKSASGGGSASRKAAPITRRFLVVLGAIVAGAFAWRVFTVLALRPTSDVNNPSDYFLNGDAFYYHWQGIALGAGHFFVNPVRYAYEGAIVPSAAHPPLYPLYLGAWSAIGIDGVTAHRIASCLLGAVTVGLIGILVQRLMGNRAAIVAAVIAALYPQLWINDGMLLSETAAQFATALALLAAYWFWESPTLRRGALLGATVGFAALGRSELILFFPLVAIPMALLKHRHSAWKPRIQLAVVTCAVGALVMAPWVVFNLARFRETTLVSTGQWSAISAGTCDVVFYGRDIGYYSACFRGPYPPKSADESERDIEPRKFAQDYIEDNLDQLPAVVAARVGRLWNVFKPGQNTFFDWAVEGRGKMQSWAGLVMFYALWPFAIFGAVTMRRRKIPLIPMVALFVIATFAAAITFGVTRYRAPFEVALVVMAAIGVEGLWERFSERRARATSADPA